MSELRSYVEGPRWARFDKWLKTYAHMKSLQITVDGDTSWVREIVRFSASGSSEELRQLQVAINLAVDNYNKDDES